MMLITFGIHLYEICTKNVFLICLVYFQNCSNKKKSHYGFKAYPWLNGQYMLPYYSKNSFFFLNLMPKRVILLMNIHKPNRVMYDVSK